MKFRIGLLRVNVTVISLIILYVFTFQIFFYIKDLPILYAISKGGVPMLGFMVTFIVLFVWKEKPKYSMQVFWSAIGLMVLSAFTAAIHYGQPLSYGLIAQAKIFPFFFFFLTYAALRVLKADLKDITQSLLWFGSLTTLSYLYVNLFVDPRPIFEANFDSQLVYFSFEKGFRFLFDIVPGIIVTFYFFRKYLMEKKPLYIIPVLLFIVYHAIYQKQRVELLTLLLILGLLALQKVSLPKKIAFISLFSFSFVYLFTQFEYFSVMLDTSSGKSDSLNVRMNTIGQATEFLLDNPLNFLFGSGFLNPLLFDKTVQDIYGINFWPADIGWLGITFELGFVGVLVFVFLYLSVFRAATSMKDNEAPLMMLAIKDYIIFSIIYSVMALKIVFQSGIFMSILAILVYVSHLLGKEKLVKMRIIN
ncbi:hypothetical protein R9C00_20240 [Flammeovirgaceae bacterium SG7u.111]|nr:hypothetical protein [Flammeovirgaceae bacterium SG7u.132]WPO34032.1 hypothetical protein R9C00_20240 [Flammeovirgaceae bacterium SG7u.111]